MVGVWAISSVFNHISPILFVCMASRGLVLIDLKVWTHLDVFGCKNKNVKNEKFPFGDLFWRLVTWHLVQKLSFELSNTPGVPPFWANLPGGLFFNQNQNFSPNLIKVGETLAAHYNNFIFVVRWSNMNNFCDFRDLNVWFRFGFHEN